MPVFRVTPDQVTNNFLGGLDTLVNPLAKPTVVIDCYTGQGVIIENCNDSEVRVTGARAIRRASATGNGPIRIILDESLLVPTVVASVRPIPNLFNHSIGPKLRTGLQA